MRLFVAAFPPPRVQQALIEAVRTLPPNAFRPTAPERVHLTLKFLGEVQLDNLPRIVAALEPVTDEHEPFEVVTSAFGVFPSPRRARILWAGIDEGADQLHALAKTVEALLKPEGFPPEEKPYVPHLTLGRSRRPTTFDPTGVSLPTLQFTISNIDLVQNKHGPTGITYPTLKRYDL